MNYSAKTLGIALVVSAMTAGLSAGPAVASTPSPEPALEGEELDPEDQAIANDYDLHNIDEGSVIELTPEQMELIKDGATLDEVMAEDGTASRSNSVNAADTTCTMVDEVSQEEVCISFGGPVPQELTNQRSVGAQPWAYCRISTAEGSSATGGRVTRYEFCQSEVVQIARTQGCTVVGGASGWGTKILRAEPGITKVSQEMTLQFVSGWGNHSGLTITSEYRCDGCRTESAWDWNNQPLAVGPEYRTARYSFVDVPMAGASVQVKNTTTDFTAKVHFLGSLKATSTTGPLNARCDVHFVAGTQACVFNKASGRHTVNRINQESYYDHLMSAMNSGLPGFTYGNSLSRTKHQTTVNQNRKISCGASRTPARPTGKSCDEYPFASTLQGAASGTQVARSFTGCGLTDPLRSGPDGFSRCFINETHNSRGGGHLSAFYAKNRVGEEDPFHIILK